MQSRLHRARRARAAARRAAGRRPSVYLGLLACVPLLGLACGDAAGVDPVGAAAASASSFAEPWDIPANARRFRLDLARERDASDGAGQARLLEPVDASGATRVRAGSRQRFVIEYAAGPLGIAVGGEIQLIGSQFWGWDAPQIDDRDAGGFVQFTTSAEGIVLEPRKVASRIAAVRIAGRSLRPGERVRIVYGAGPARAAVDRFAEHDSALWLAVDGNADGVRGILIDSPLLDVLPGPAAELRVFVPTTAAPGDEIELHVSVVDAEGNAGVELVGAELEIDADGLELPARVPFATAPRDLPGTLRLRGRALETGVHRVRARIRLGDGEPLLSDVSNPLVVRAGLDPLLWGDLHGHSNYSDGSGTPEDYFAYARSVSGLDLAALTDHDHWGTPLLDGRPERWERIQRAVAAAHDPGHFVALIGYEWTSWLHGHRHVLYFSDQGPLLSSLDPATDSPPALWRALRDRPALTFAHHSAGSPIPVDWRFAPDPVLEPVTELVSRHGSSESSDSPGLIRDFVPGNSIRDTLAAGYRLGFIGSGDSHDGHPGGPPSGSPPRGGLAAIVGAERTRASVLEALRARRAYATNGARIWLDVRLDGARAGSVVPVPPLPRGDDRAMSLRVDFAAEHPVARIDVVRSGRIETSLPGRQRASGHEDLEIAPLTAGETLYVRLVEEGESGAAWSSPFFAE